MVHLALAVDVVNFFLSLVLVAMAHMEYRVSKDRMFNCMSGGFAFWALAQFVRILQYGNLLPGDVWDALQIIAGFVGFFMIICGIYTQSKIYKVIR